ncbi:hypothetical protein [Paenibacillus sp. N3.4]|uniref:hypothetical protein n=1 Tax=Paenibacillus sp. N3.4 TaxID=2603222 RepID=UPI001C9C23C1|nr:hypothetical protein [Paenibacillus sp. N3.4]
MLAGIFDLGKIRRTKDVLPHEFKTMDCHLNFDIQQSALTRVVGIRNTHPRSEYHP